MSDYVYPITFEEASKKIDDPNYGVGLPGLLMLPLSHPFTAAAQIHDLRYDYLIPGQSTSRIDSEFHAGCLAAAGENEGREKEANLFYKIVIIRGCIFTLGPEICHLIGHNFKPCSYGQKDNIFDMRCGNCGIHKPLEKECA